MTGERPGLSILDEDDDVLILDKPAGLVCHPSKDGPLSSLIGRVRLYLGHGEGRLVHRLDRETSGVVVVAKSAEVARELGRVFAGDGASKTYHALVHGRLAAPELVIDVPLGKDDSSPVAIKDAVRADGAPARSEVRLVRAVDTARGGFSLVEVTPRTGRKHQIRIHLAHAGYPIVGDKIYGGDVGRYLRFVVGDLTEADRQALVLEHQALSASRLSFEWRGRRREWTSGLGAVESWLRSVEGPISSAAAFR